MRQAPQEVPDSLKPLPLLSHWQHQRPTGSVILSPRTLERERNRYHRAGTPPEERLAPVALVAGEAVLRAWLQLEPLDPEVLAVSPFHFAADDPGHSMLRMRLRAGNRHAAHDRILAARTLAEADVHHLILCKETDFEDREVYEHLRWEKAAALSASDVLYFLNLTFRREGGKGSTKRKTKVFWCASIDETTLTQHRLRESLRCPL